MFTYVGRRPWESFILWLKRTIRQSYLGQQEAMETKRDMLKVCITMNALDVV